MKKQLLISALLLMVTGCSENNPLTQVTPDALATSINQFDTHEMGNGATQCADIFTGTTKAQGPDDSVCNDYAKALHHGLIHDPRFKGATLANVKDSATWRHYLTSKLAKKAWNSDDFNRFEPRK